LHRGHLQHFEAAAALGLPVICQANDDAYIATKHPVVIPISDRLAVLQTLRPIQAVYAGTAGTADVIRQLKPKFYCKGEDWKGRLPREDVDACRETGTAAVFRGARVASSSQYASHIDEKRLGVFEEMVLSQQPAREPWQPVTDYSFEARRKAEGRHPQLIADTFKPAHVLDYGCGFGHLVALLREQGVRAFGVDPFVTPEHPYCYPEKEITLAGEDFDLVVCREVCEHLTVRGIAKMVRVLCALTDKYVYLTTRFHPAPVHLLDFETRDDLDPTHISMLSQTFLRALFALEGFRRRKDLEAKMDWQHKGRCLVYERA